MDNNSNILDSLGNILEKYATSIIQQLKEKLISYNKDASGRLLASIRFENIKLEDNSSYNLKIIMEDYWINVNDGRAKGKKQPPTSVIKEWIQDRGIKAPKAMLDRVGKVRIRGKKKGIKITKDDVYNQFAYIISKSIKKKGIKPTNFFQEVITEQLIKNIENEIAEEIKQNITINFTKDEFEFNTTT